jgi:tetratricopeptide (TPR) repeat protein
VAEIARRREVASAAVSGLEAMQPDQWAAMAQKDKQLHNPEAVRRLLSRAAASSRTTPSRAIALAQTALLCCDAGDVRPAVRFDVLKDLARYSLRGSEDLTAALGALDEAEKIIPATEDPVYYAALLAYARACVWGDAKSGQWTRTLRHLDLCEDVLRRRDATRWRAARHLRAVTLALRGNCNEALTVFAQLMFRTPDDFSRAVIYSDLADCYCRMGQLTDALVFLDRALPAILRRLHDVASLHLSCFEKVRPLACALDADQPFRSGDRRALIWTELYAAHRDGRLRGDAVIRTSKPLRHSFA